MPSVVQRHLLFVRSLGRVNCKCKLGGVFSSRRSTHGDFLNDNKIGLCDALKYIILLPAIR